MPPIQQNENHLWDLRDKLQLRETVEADTFSLRTPFNPGRGIKDRKVGACFPSSPVARVQKGNCSEKRIERHSIYFWHWQIRSPGTCGKWGVVCLSTPIVHCNLLSCSATCTRFLYWSECARGCTFEGERAVKVTVTASIWLPDHCLGMAFILGSLQQID